MMLPVTGEWVIVMAELEEGENTLELRAKDNNGMLTEETFTFSYNAGEINVEDDDGSTVPGFELMFVSFAFFAVLLRRRR